MQIRPINRFSIRGKLIALMLAVTIPLGTLLIVQNLYAISTMHDKVAQTNKDLLSVYMGQIDQGLRFVDYYMSALTTRETALLALESYASNDDTAYQLAKLEIQGELSNTVPLFAVMDAMFVYSSERDEFIEAFNAQPGYEEKQLIRGYIRGVTADASIEGNNVWKAQKIGGKYYVMRIMKLGGSYLGAWGRAEGILTPLELIDLSKGGKALFATSDGKPMGFVPWIVERGIDLGKGFSSYHLTGSKEKYLVVGAKSKMGDFALAAVIPDSTVSAGLPSSLSLILWLSIFAMLLIPFALFLVQRNVLDPLGRMVAAMRSIQGGELDTRMRTTPSSSEFAIVDSTFNGMMERIRDLKIDVYEEKLNAQKAELKHLQLQIKPHFYLNSLNIIFHMAQMREFELIQEMTLKLVDYFRYMMKSDSSFVSLGEEIEHVRTYQRIQEIRLAGERSLALEAPGEAMTAAVPPLLIQTFVENSGKYGIEEDGSLHISIGISLSENRESIAIRIADRGRGFSEPMLASLNTGTLEPDENGEKIGIFNMRRRLSILYHGRASLGFENGEPGAIVSIGIPFTE